MKLSAVISMAVGDFLAMSGMSVSLLEISRASGLSAWVGRATLVIRCLESELYDAIVALSIIPIGLLCSSWFDASRNTTFPDKKNPRVGQKIRNVHTKVYPFARVYTGHRGHRPFMRIVRSCRAAPTLPLVCQRPKLTMWLPTF